MLGDAYFSRVHHEEFLAWYVQRDMYDTEDQEVRSQIDYEVCAVEALSVVSPLSQFTCGIPSCLKPTGFQATLKFLMGHPNGSCGKAQEAPVLLCARRAVPRCSPAFRSFATGSSRDRAVNVWKQCRLANLHIRLLVGMGPKRWGYGSQTFHVVNGWWHWV